MYVFVYGFCKCLYSYDIFNEFDYFQSFFFSSKILLLFEISDGIHHCLFIVCCNFSTLWQQAGQGFSHSMPVLLPAYTMPFTSPRDMSTRRQKSSKIFDTCSKIGSTKMWSILLAKMIIIYCFKIVWFFLCNIQNFTCVLLQFMQ